MEKIIAASRNQGEETFQPVLESSVGANPRGYELYIGLPVTIVSKGLSNQNKGVIIGFKQSSTGKLLAKVKWLEGAPPITIDCLNVESSLPRDVYFLVQDPSVRRGQTVGQENQYWSAGRGIGSRLYYDRDEAITIATQTSIAKKTKVLVMRIDALCNGTEIYPL